jgi:hypothetical protein
LCHSRQQAEQVKARLAAWLAPRGLAFNEDKTRIVTLEEGFDFLGFTVRRYHGKLLIKPSKAAVRRIRERLRSEVRSLRGANAQAVIARLNPVVRGWAAYYRTVVSEPVFRSLDGWLRRRLRQVRWKEWKSTAAKRHNLRIRGISESSARKWAGSSKGYWRVAGSKVLQVSLPNSYWNRLGLKTLSQTWQRLNPTA